MKVTGKGLQLPQQLAEYIINMSQSDTDELRVLVYVLSEQEELSTEEIGKALGLSETEVISAVSFWRGAGLIANAGKTRKKEASRQPATESAVEEKPRSLPASVRDTDTKVYTGEEIARIMTEKPEIASLLDFAQERLEKVFSPSDISKLVYLQDYVLLSAPMIMSIIDYCVENDRKSMRYVEKTALSIYDEGIYDYAALEAYFEKKRMAKSSEGVVRRIMGIGDRGFTAKEKEHIAKWFSEYKSGEDLISLAYERTIANTTKPSVPYMSKILASWYEKGYKTPSDVESGKAQSDGTGGKINLDKFDEAAKNTKSDQNSVEKPGLNLEDFFENP